MSANSLLNHHHGASYLPNEPISGSDAQGIISNSLDEALIHPIKMIGR